MKTRREFWVMFTVNQKTECAKFKNETKANEFMAGYVKSSPEYDPNEPPYIVLHEF